MTLQKRSYTSGHFELVIDGHKSSAFLKTVDGGFVKASPVDEPVGPHNMRIKHTSIAEVEPITIDFGLSSANEILKWVQQSWRKEYGRRSGQITHADFNLKPTFEHEFYEALITETAFPALDGSSKETAYLKVKMQPERVVTRKVSGGPMLKSNTGSKQKLWSASSFRLNIDGLEGMEYTNKIEAFTIKQGTKKVWLGEMRYPQIEPTKIEFPNISGTISLEYADQLVDWYQKYVVDGQSDPAAQKSGSIEFLAPDKKRRLFAINLYEVGIHSLQMVSSQANQDQIKRVKFELYVGHMDLDGAGALGME